MLSVRLFIFAILSAVCVHAGEFAVLSSGFRIHADSHVVDGDKILLKADGGVIELPANTVAGFEQEEYTPPPPAPTTPAPALVTPQPAPRDTKEMVTQIAKNAGLPPALVHSVVRAESAYQTNAVSPKGAIGLMQLMPGTAAELNADPHDPKQNVEAGVAYLRDLLIKYQNDPHQVTKAIAAYNAGPGAVDKYNGIPPYHETVDYVNRVVKQYLKEQAKEQPKQ